jgi:hypothetical protein
MTAPLADDVTVLAEPPSGSAGFAMDAIDIRWDTQPAPTTSLAAAHVEARWSRYVEDARVHGKILFNGPITRLIRASRENHRVNLHLGPADYKTFVVTRLRDRAWFEDHAPAAMVLALGNSVLLTHGNRALLGIRSPQVSAYAGRAHLLGGVLDVLGTSEFPASNEGMIQHLWKELKEEAGVETQDLLSEGPMLQAVVHENILGQPEAIWQWETRVSLDDIAHRIDRGEHASWLIVAGEADPDEQTWLQMTPVARYSWRRWSNFMASRAGRKE